MDRLRVWSGWERLAGRCHDKPGKGLENFAALYDAKACRPEYVDGELGEYRDFETADKQAARLTSFGNKPLLILSKDPARRETGITPDATAKLSIWDREQEELKSLSPLSWRVIAHDSGHNIYQDRPGLVLAEMSRLITYLRSSPGSGPAPPFGSTSTQ